MSKILALDTSTDACSVALAIDGEISEEFAVIPREHTKRLLPMVDTMLAEHQLAPTQLDAIAFGRGPGSFTGLRICLGVVQGLAFGANLPVIPVSTLAAMAAGAYRTGVVPEDSSLLVALDARMDEIYGALYRRGEDEHTLVSLLGEEYVMAPPLAVEKTLAESRELTDNIIGVGPGWHYPALAALEPKAVVLDCHPHALDIAALAVEAFARGETVDVMDAQPVYLRDKVSWKKRQRIRKD